MAVDAVADVVEEVAVGAVEVVTRIRDHPTLSCLSEIWPTLVRNEL